MVSAWYVVQTQDRRRAVVYEMRRDSRRRTQYQRKESMDEPTHIAECSFAAVIPLRTVSAANAREHWTRKAARNKKERLAVAAYFQTMPSLFRTSTEAILVSFTRYAKRDLDDDNLAGSFKAIRDEVAMQLNRYDGPKSGIRWCYTQERGDYAIRIEVKFDRKR